MKTFCASCGSALNAGPARKNRNWPWILALTFTTGTGGGGDPDAKKRIELGVLRLAAGGPLTPDGVAPAQPIKDQGSQAQ